MCIVTKGSNEMTGGFPISLVQQSTMKRGVDSRLMRSEMRGEVRGSSSSRQSLIQSRQSAKRQETEGLASAWHTANSAAATLRSQILQDDTLDQEPPI